MSELTRLQEMRARLADPDPHRLAAIRSQVTGHFVESRPSALIPRRTRLRLAVVAVVLALAAGATVVEVVGGHHGGPFTTPNAAAADLLNRAAAAADTQPDLKVRPDQYLYIERHGKEIAGPPMEEIEKPYPVKSNARWSDDDPPYYVDVRTEWWRSVGRKEEFLDRSHTGHPTPFAPGMKLPAHVPGLGNEEELTAWCEPGGPWEPTYQWMSTLPTDPERLRGKVFQDIRRPAEKWEVIRTMLNMGVLSSKLRAALFRVGSTIPGVTMAGNVEDALGHRGTAIEFTYTTEPINLKMVGQLVFDPKTYRYLGSRDLLGERYAGLPVGTVWNTNAVGTMKAVGKLPRLYRGTVHERC
jgi:hypothetical protein